MTELRLRLHACSFVLRGPEEALRHTASLYYPSVIERAGAHPSEPAPTAAFEIARLENGWRLIEEGVSAPLGEFERPAHALLCFEHAVEGHLLANLDPPIAFHAGAVVTGDGACLLAGNADSGKSSSTLQLVELGHRFLAEEIAAVDGLGRVRPHLQSLALDPRVVVELGGAAGLAHGRIERLDELLDRYLPTQVATEPAPLATIVLPAYRPGQSTRVEELRPETVLTELLGYCFEPAGDPEAAIDRIIELTGRARLLRVSYPDATAAREAWTDLFGAARP